MNPAALPVVPISLSLLARYVKEKRRKKKGKRNQRNQQLFTFHSKSFILNNIYLLHTCVSVCLCVPDVASRRFSRGARSFHQKVHLRRRSWFVVRRRLLSFARKTKSNGHHLPAGRCQLCCEAENPNSPSPKKGEKPEKKRKKKETAPAHSHALFASTRDEYQ